MLSVISYYNIGFVRVISKIQNMFDWQQIIANPSTTIRE
jgi:hypothetical protein